MEAGDWLTILRPRDRTGLLPVCWGGAGCVEFWKARPARKLNELPSPDPSELSGRPHTEDGKGDGDIGLPLKIPSSGARSGGSAAFSGLRGAMSGKAELTL
jgi:hypothetical protein